MEQCMQENCMLTFILISLTVELFDIVSFRLLPLSFTCLILVDCLVVPSFCFFKTGKLCPILWFNSLYVLGVGSGSRRPNIRTVISVVS